MSKPFSFVLLLLALSACTTNVSPITVEFPTPLIEPMPASVGLMYDDDLKNFSYNETVSDGTTWNIQLGESNIRLFNRLFGAMFTSTTELFSLDEAAGAGIDGVIRPVLEEYAFLTPDELGSNFYAVSIRYRIFLYDAAGEQIAAWPVNAYGQSRAGRFDAGRFRVSPLQEATNLAMRDAAAGAIITLRQQPEIIALAGLEQTTAETDEN